MNLLYISKKSIVVILLLFILQGCKKGNKPAPDYSIIVSGSSYTGNTVYCSSDIPPGNEYKWNFGDGGSSTSSAPEHVYKNTGWFHVTLTLNGDTAHLLSKTLTIGTDSIHMATISGTATYHHEYTSSKNYYDTTPARVTTYPDESISLTVVDPITAVFRGDTLYCWAGDDSALYFSYSSVLVYPSYESSMKVNFISRKIGYSKSTHQGSGGTNSVDCFWTP